MATLVLILGMTAIWVQRQVLDRDEWVETSVELLENDDIRRALGLYIIDQIYTNVDVADEIEQALPDRLQPLAEPAAGALRRAAEDNAGTLLGTAAAENLWRRANERAHDLFEEVLGEDSGDVTIDLQPLIEHAGERGGVLARAVEKLPPDAGQLEVLKPDQLETAQKVVKALKPLAIVLTLIALAALAQAPASEPAVVATWAIGTRLLIDVVTGAVLLAILLILGAWLLGPGRVATPSRRALTPALRDQPWLVRLGLGALLLLLIWWNPVPWTGKPLAILIVAVGAFAWLELIRHRALDEDIGGGAPAAPMESAPQPS